MEEVLAMLRSLAPELAGVSDGEINRYIALAQLGAPVGSAPNDQKTKILALYTAHLVATGGSSTQGVISEKEGDLQRTYSQNRNPMLSSIYGKILLDLLAQISAPMSIAVGESNGKPSYCYDCQG